MMAVAMILVTVPINTHAEENAEDRRISWDTYSTVYNGKVSESNTYTQYSAEDIYLLAQTIDHEAGLEPIEGQVAVAEIIRNRLHSDKFPNTVKDIIFAPSQFSKSSEIPYVEPTALQLYIAEEVLDEELSIFDNNTVLFFKNPKIVDGIPPDKEVDWGDYKYYTYVGKHAFYTYES